MRFPLFRKYYRKFVVPQLLREDILAEQLREEKYVLALVPEGSFTSLNEDEKENVNRVWKMNIPSWREFECYKHICGFDARFMPMSVYLPIISRKLNNYNYTGFYEHKSLLGRCANTPPCVFPLCFVRVIDGEFYNDNMEQIDTHSAIQCICQQEKVVFKESIGSSGGRGILILTKGDSSLSVWESRIKEKLQEYGRDFIVQEYLEEHESLKQFNPSSVNTIRIQSLYLNGRFSVLHCILRTGSIGSVVDNICSGGIICGVAKDGHLNKYGINAKMELYEERNGIVFSKTILPFIPKLINLVEDLHTHNFSLCKYIGWDFIINKDGIPICIELNSSQNGHLGFQIADGPTFGDRTEEVIEYCQSRDFKYNKSLFAY